MGNADNRFMVVGAFCARFDGILALLHAITFVLLLMISWDGVDFVFLGMNHER